MWRSIVFWLLSFPAEAVDAYQESGSDEQRRADDQDDRSVQLAATSVQNILLLRAHWTNFLHQNDQEYNRAQGGDHVVVGYSVNRLHRAWIAKINLLTPISFASYSHQIYNLFTSYLLCILHYNIIWNRNSYSNHLIIPLTFSAQNYNAVQLNTVRACEWS